MSDPIECPITEIKVVTCPVKTCAYHTNHATGNCMVYRGLIDDPEYHSEEIADVKGIPLAQFKSMVQKGRRQIERVMVINDFLTWLDDKPWHMYPKTEAYRDEELIEYISNLASHTFPFNLPLLRWNMGKVAALVHDKVWKEYSKYKEIEFASVSVSTGLPKRKVIEIQDKFQAAYKRQTPSNRRK